MVNLASKAKNRTFLKEFFARCAFSPAHDHGRAPPLARAMHVALMRFLRPISI